MSLKILSKRYTPWNYLFTGVPKSFLIGNVCEPMRCEVDFSYAVEKEYTTASKLIVDLTSAAVGLYKNTLTNADATAWQDSGFAVGDSIVINYTAHTSSASAAAIPATVVTLANKPKVFPSCEQQQQRAGFQHRRHSARNTIQQP